MMNDEILTEMNRVFLARVESVEKVLELSREDAARLLQQVFERATTLEVLAVLYKEYGYMPKARDAEALRRDEEEARRIEAAREAQEQARLAEEEARKALEKARQAEAEARRLKEAEEKARRTEAEAQRAAEKARLAEERARAAEAEARRQEEEARQVEAARLAEEEAQRAEAAAREAVKQARQAAEALQMLERIQSSTNLVELQDIFDEAEAGSSLRDLAARQIANVFQGMIAKAVIARELENLARELPVQLPRNAQAELMSQLSAQWETILNEKVTAARDVDDLNSLTRMVMNFWQICDWQNWTTIPAQRVYTRIIQRWLPLVVTRMDLQGVDLPTISFAFSDEPRPILSEPALLKEAEKAWDSFLQTRIAFAGSLQQLKELYHSQNWDEYYPQAKKRILETWNELTSEALDGRSSFEALGQVVKNGGSEVAVHRWIEVADSWEHVTEVYATVDLGVNKTPHYTQLVEKILVYADTEDKIRQAHGLLRSHALSWMMGDKSVAEKD